MVHTRGETTNPTNLHVAVHWLRALAAAQLAELKADVARHETDRAARVDVLACRDDAAAYDLPESMQREGASHT